MDKALNVIGIAGIALGIFFIVASFFFGGPWLAAMGVPVGMPAIVGGIVFLAFAYVIQLLERIASSLRAAAEEGRAVRAAGEQTKLQLDQLGPPIRALRSIGDAAGGITSTQRGMIIEFIMDCYGGKLSPSAQAEATVWIDNSIGQPENDLQALRHMSGTLRARFLKALGRFATTNSAHLTEEAKISMAGAIERIRASISA